MMTVGGFISIKEPCHVGWENMSVSEKGRFCSSCRKDVHDFSNSSIDEIRKAYLENEGALCGHVPVKILQEQYVENEIRKIHFSFVKKIFMAALLCFGATLFTIDAAKASILYKLKLSFISFTAPVNDTIIVKGIIKDRDTYEAVPFVKVSLLHNDSVIVQTTTDLDGAYKLSIPAKYSKVDIKADFIGYATKMIKGVNLSPGKQIVIDLDIQMQVQRLDGMMEMYKEPLINGGSGSSGETIKEELERTPK